MLKFFKACHDLTGKNIKPTIRGHVHYSYQKYYTPHFVPLKRNEPKMGTQATFKKTPTFEDKAQQICGMWHLNYEKESKR
jgi:hypothetical protein